MKRIIVGLCFINCVAFAAAMMFFNQAEQAQKEVAQLTENYAALEEQYHFIDRYPQKAVLVQQAEEGFGAVFQDDPMPWHPNHISEVLNAVIATTKALEYGNAGWTWRRPWDNKPLVLRMDTTAELSDGANAGYVADKHEVIFSESFFYGGEPQWRAGTVTHELAHVYNYVRGHQRFAPPGQTSFSVGERAFYFGQYLIEAGYAAVSGWVGGPLDAQDIPTAYAWSAREDFAESFSLYLGAPEYLNAYFPERYEWLRNNVFGGWGWESVPWPARAEDVKEKARIVARYIFCEMYKFTKLCGQ